MSGQWVCSQLHSAPHSIRPETHWLYEIGDDCQPLWFSLQLSRGKAEELYEAFAPWGKPGHFRKLIRCGASMAPASHAALGLALQAYPQMSRLGADILVPRKAFAALQELESNSGCSDDLRDFEITDSGLAIHHVRDWARERSEDPPEDMKKPANSKARMPDSEIPLVPAAKQDDGEKNKRDRVIIAIIDDGVGIANRRFRRTDKHTRIKHFLDLQRPSGNECKPRPRNELLARSWTGQQIDKVLGKNPDDEESVYRALDLIGRWDARQPLRASASHGTHMLDTAAGFETSDASREKRPIIAVQVPAQIPETRSDTWLPQSLKRALDWILVKANELSVELAQDEESALRLPLIVNCSLASMAGPKDGLSDLERRITQFVETYRSGGPDALCTVVLSAGNFLLTRTSARLSQPGTEKGKPLCWRIQPDDKTSSFVEIWGPPTDVNTQQISVTLKPPRDPVGTSPPSSLGHVLDWQIDNAVYARLYHQIVRRPGGKWRECITIATRPTVNESGDPHIVPFGGWEIAVDAPNLERLHPPSSETKTDTSPYIYLRIHHNEPGLYAHGKARQSYFDDPLYKRYDPISGAVNSDETKESSRRATRNSASVVRLQGTLTSYAYAKGVLVVGGYNRSDGTPISYSASGAAALPRAAWGWAGPDLAAVTEESEALWGILGTGTYSGSVIYLNGTSVAAPLAVRALADWIERGGSVASFLHDNIGSNGAVCGPHGPYQSAIGRPLRFGAGRLRFESSYKKRIDP